MIDMSRDWGWAVAHGGGGLCYIIIIQHLFLRHISSHS